MTERERDKRDLKILDAYLAGEGQRKTAEKFGVSQGYVQHLIRAWKEAA